MVGLAAALVFASASAQVIKVYKSPACSCCALWMEHLKRDGFTVHSREVNDLTPVKERLGVPHGMGSCHTAVVAGYTIEGHVPAADIRRLLKERPQARGLAVPGMPQGSPGMEAGGQTQRYETLLFQDNDRHSVFARH